MTAAMTQVYKPVRIRHEIMQNTLAGASQHKMHKTDVGPKHTGCVSFTAAVPKPWVYPVGSVGRCIFLVLRPGIGIGNETERKPTCSVRERGGAVNAAHNKTHGAGHGSSYY